MRKPEGHAGDDRDRNLGGVLKTFTGLIEMLSKLSEEGGSIERSGEVQKEEGKLRAVYGFSVRVGGGGSPKVEPFGNVRVSKAGTKVEESREPLIDLFDEPELVLVVAEIPGVNADDVSFEVHDDILEINAKRGDRSYHKELLLPAVVDGPRASSSYHNGVLEIRLPKKT